jgi:hypothetical protein
MVIFQGLGAPSRRMVACSFVRSKVIVAEDLVLGGHAPNYDKESPCGTAQ